MADAEDSNDFDEREKMLILTTITTPVNHLEPIAGTTNNVFDVDFEIVFGVN